MAVNAVYTPITSSHRGWNTVVVFQCDHRYWLKGSKHNSESNVMSYLKRAGLGPIKSEIRIRNLPLGA